MNLEEIKKNAKHFRVKNAEALRDKVCFLKDSGVSFLGCVAFVQANQSLCCPMHKSERSILMSGRKMKEKKSTRIIDL
jgi:hypothetical protein